LLTRIARQQRLPWALTMLLSSRTLRYHGLRYVKSVLYYRRAATLARLKRIDARLFASDEPTNLAAAESPA